MNNHCQHQEVVTFKYIKKIENFNISSFLRKQRSLNTLGSAETESKEQLAQAGDDHEEREHCGL